MNCKEIQNLLHAYGDGELDVMTSLEVEKHIQTCAQCKRTLENQIVLGKAVATSAPYFKMPSDLRESILHSARQAVQAEQPRITRHRWQWNPLATGLAMAASLVLGFFLAMQFQQHSARDLLVGELASSHVRSLLATHLIDVVSTDQHTVKPWFDGKLDFAPPVNDLAAQGYSLEGGRLDYIGGRTVAVLIYKKQKHFINIFIWPSSGSGEELQLAAKNGYNLVNWNHSGMTFWAVSDMNQKDLMEFSGLIEKY
ncbi:MAG: anti-sigma factor [Chthoniobacteraceae bacterium]